MFVETNPALCIHVFAETKRALCMYTFCYTRSFGWDNEYGSREFSVPSFEAAKHMVTNGEFLEFVADAGYARQELWSDVGWRWKMFRNVKKPQSWVSEVSRGGQSMYFFRNRQQGAGSRPQGEETLLCDHGSEETNAQNAASADLK